MFVDLCVNKTILFNFEKTTEKSLCVCLLLDDRTGGGIFFNSIFNVREERDDDKKMGIYFSHHAGSDSSSELLLYKRIETYDVDEAAGIETDSPDAAELRAQFVESFLKRLEQGFWEARKYESAPDVARVVVKSSWLGLVQAREVQELDDPKEANAGATTMWLGDRTELDGHNRTLVLFNRPYFGITHMHDATSRGVYPYVGDREYDLPTEIAIISYDAKVDFVKKSRKLVVNRKPALRLFWVTIDQRNEHSSFVAGVHDLIKTELKMRPQHAVPSTPASTRSRPGRPDSTGSVGSHASTASSQASGESVASAASRDSNGSFVTRFFRGLVGSKEGAEPSEKETAEVDGQRQRNPSRFGSSLSPTTTTTTGVDMVRKDLKFKDPRQRAVLNYIIEQVGVVLRERTPKSDLWKTVFPRSNSRGRLVPENISKRNLLYYVDLQAVLPNSLVGIALLLDGGRLTSASAKAFASLNRSHISHLVDNAVEHAGGKNALFSEIVKQAKREQQQ